ncbi:MAG TPA: ABC transporter substrate-binding protein [Candidatus Binatia bacterium]|jgi:NitT/TauT family transport system substrate-binding protein|nr:ABC transporter substrate-binding protein [Candidatus Binatia bacterium]
MHDELKKRARIARLILGIGMLLISPPAKAAAPTALRIAYPAPTASFLPLWAAQEAGFFKKHDLSVELIQVGSSTRGMAALIAGQVDILAGGGTGGIVAQLQGFTDLAIFGTNVHTWVFSVYAGPAINDVAQLRGKKLGVTRFGGTMDFAARYFLRQRGLEPGKDVALIQVGAPQDIVTALANGVVDAGVMSVPYVFFARRLGLRELADLSQGGIRYAQAALVAKRSFLKNKQDVVARFIKASIEATYFIKNRPEDGMRILGRYTRTEDVEILKLAYDYHVHKLLSAVPDIRADDVKLLLEEAVQSNPKAKGANPRDFIDEMPVREVVRSGFVEQIYKK